MQVSVIIPAYNAAETIAETLEALCKQSFSRWEAVIVDDGSVDETAVIVQQYTAADERFRLISQANGGVCAARNTGIAAARYEWLLFLDADDWITEDHLEKTTGVLLADPSLDAVHCGWAYITPDGTRHPERCVNETGDLFPLLAVNCFPCIHSCVLRRSLVQDVGGFDTSFIVCEDWDLWQRVARTGARFGVTCDVLSLYRMRPGSASDDGVRMLVDGLRVLEQAYKADPRVPKPDPKHMNGLPADYDAMKKLNFACWNAGLMLGAGQDPLVLLTQLEGVREPNLEPPHVATSLFQAPLIPLCKKLTDWRELWLDLEVPMITFLEALEAHTQAVGLARRTVGYLEMMILRELPASFPLTIGRTHAIHLEVTEPIPSLTLPPVVERLHCYLVLEGEKLGLLELPVCDGWVPDVVLKDAIAAEYAWPILGRFFGHTLYPQLRLEQKGGQTTIWRGKLRLAEAISPQEDTFWTDVHDVIGWTVLLQALWQRPSWHDEAFYDASLVERGSKQAVVVDGRYTVAITADLPTLQTQADNVLVVVTVGGAVLGPVNVSVSQGQVTAQALRVAINETGGLELCRLAVRQALIGSSLQDPTTLHARFGSRPGEGSRQWLFTKDCLSVGEDAGQVGYFLADMRWGGLVQLLLVMPRCLLLLYEPSRFLCHQPLPRLMCALPMLCMCRMY